MKQIVFKGERTLEFRRVDIPRPDENQALLRTLVSGISAGTEGMWWNATATALKTGRKSYPYFPGYELVGEVIEVGPAFKRLQPGDRVFAMKPHADHALIGVSDIWFKLPEQVTDEQAVAIALTGTTVHAIHRAEAMLGDSCAVIGLGVLGFNLVQALARGMACKVIAVTDSPKKQALARAVGAAEAISHDTALKTHRYQGFSKVFDCSGVNAGMMTAVQLAADQGTVIAAGFYTEPLQIDGEALFARELTIRGVRATGAVQGDPYNRWDRSATMQLAFDLVASRTVTNDSIITHRFTPEQAQDAYDLIVDKREPYLQILFDWRS